ncbi:hypothetical protein HY04_05005 [Kaistella antarctica]|uniref:DKNYY family protein n=1 Tax=Kaistella antarctica TaxID=266748 RepID=A0ABR4TW43_9FLAO|nr:DKNYY domain-containing protein [Kaistella antarctica]KEY17900.1 hypothetical protein HY04_05005 [Kaistella antarctica]
MINQISIKVVLAILVILLSSCNTDKNTEVEKSLTLQAKDSWKYKHLKGKFYTDKYGKLFEQKVYAIAGKGETINSQIYFDSLVYINLDDTVIEKSLSEAIDIKTYAEFDEEKIVSGANPKIFKPLSDYLYGIDSKNIFYRGKKIEGLNFEKHEILYSLDTTDFFIDYIKDDKVVFYDGDTVKGADAKTFKLVAGQKWRAEDKNYKYECCGQRVE